jgi:hypothetical protein
MSITKGVPGAKETICLVIIKTGVGWGMDTLALLCPIVVRIRVALKTR